MPTDRLEQTELMSSAALLVLDAQDCFIQTLPDPDTFLSRCAFAVDAARVLGIRTIFTEQVPHKLGHTHAQLLRRAQTPTVFPKESFSALGAPGIDAWLRDNEIYHLIVCGLETTICVYQTGLQATDEDIDITFLSDALACRRTQDEPHAVEALRRLGSQVLPSETVFYSLLREVTHPLFREFNQLVKSFSANDFNLNAYLGKTPQPVASPSEKPNPERPQRRRARPQRRSRKRTPESNNESPQQNKAPPKNAPSSAAPESPPAKKIARPQRRSRSRNPESANVAPQQKKAPNKKASPKPERAPAQANKREATQSNKPPAKKKSNQTLHKPASNAPRKSVKKPKPKA